MASKKFVFDGRDAVFGRMASVVAKELLRGNFVDVINCEEIIISGDGKLFAKKIRAKRKMGRGSSMKGPKYIRQEDRLIKRMIRGMLPWDRAKGREAFRRLRCYIGKGDVEESQVSGAKKFSHDKPMKYFRIKDIVEFI